MGLFLPKYGQKWVFHKNQARPLFSTYSPLTSCKKSGKTNKLILKKIFEIMDKWTNTVEIIEPICETVGPTNGLILQAVLRKTKATACAFSLSQFFAEYARIDDFQIIWIKHFSEKCMVSKRCQSCWTNQPEWKELWKWIF